MYLLTVLVSLLWGSKLSLGEICTSTEYTSDFNFAIVSSRNKTGHWTAQVQLGHEGDEKKVGPYEAYVDHKSAKCGKTESILLDLKITVPTSSRTGMPSAPGYELIPGLGYYKFHTDLKTWQEAKKACEDEGTHLLILNSEKEAKAMKPFFDKHPSLPGADNNGNAFAGFYSPNKNTDYVTIFNQTLKEAGYSTWNSGEPNAGSHNCGLLKSSSVLADYLCTSKNAYICESEL